MMDALDDLLAAMLAPAFGGWTAKIEPGGHGWRATISRPGLTMLASGNTPTRALYNAALTVVTNGMGAMNRVANEVLAREAGADDATS